MNCKLYFINQYGQLVLPDGEPSSKFTKDDDYYRYYNSVSSAKEVAQSFLKIHPLMSGIIEVNSTGEEIIVEAEKHDYLEAKKNKAKLDKKQYYSSKVKGVCELIMILGLILMLVYFILKIS